MRKSFEFFVETIKNLLEKGALHILAGNFFIKFVGMFGSIFLVRLLTKQEYGILGYVENLYGYAYVFAGLGIVNAGIRYCMLAESKEEKYGVYSFIQRTQVKINILIILIMICVCVLYPHPEEYAHVGLWVIILTLGIPFSNASAGGLGYERVMFDNRRYIYFSMFLSVTSIVLRLIGAGLFGLGGTVSFRTAAEIISCFVICHSLKNKYFCDVKPQQVEKEKKREIFAYAIHNLIANCAWSFFMLTDVFLIGRLLNDPATLADYKVACVIPSNMSIITASIEVFIVPYFIRNEKNVAWIRKNYIKAFFLNMLLIGMLTLFFIVTVKPLILLLYGKEYISAIPLMRVLLIAHFINAGFRSINSGLLSAMGYAKDNMIIFVCGLAIQFGLGLIVIPRYGAMGLAVNNIFMYAALSVAIIIAFVKRTHIFENEHKRIRKK